MAASSTSSVGLGRQPPTAAGGARRSESRWWCWWARLMEENHSVAKSFCARRLEERLINDYVVLQSAARKVATVLASLLLTWSTVVLLGGFVSVLKLIDFWCLTAISTSFAINLADLFQYTTTYFLAAGNIYIGLRDDLASWSSYSLGVSISMLAKAFLGVLIIVHSAVTQLLTLAPLVAIVLSLSRLHANNYGNVGGDASNAAKLKASLQIFYSLTLAQNIPFYIWKQLVIFEELRASSVSRQCRFGQWGSSLVRTYIKETKTIFERDRAVPQGRNLITFAVGLLGSESLHDRSSAVRMLDTFVKNKVPIGPSLLPSKVPLENLMQALEVGDDETRERAARIVVALAGDLRHIDQFPKALHHIASLLQASDQFPTTERTTTNMQEDQAATRKCWRNELLYGAILSCSNISTILVKEKQEDTFPSGEPKQLISQGLLIIERLALHQGNRVHICNNRVLLSKLTAPLFSHAFLDAAEHDSEWVDMLGTSLRIVARLIRAPGEATRGLHDRIARNTQSIANLTRILEDDKFGPLLKTAAIDILAELASSSHKSAMGLLDIKRFISQLWGIFLAEVDENSTTIQVEEEEQRQQASRLTHKAGEALARMLSVWDAAASSSDSILVEMFIQSTTSSEEVPTAELRHVVGQLTDMLLKSNKGSRTSAARILECLCSHFSTRHKELPRQDVISMLRKVLQLIPCITREANNCTGLGGANNNLAAQCDEENPPPEDHTGNKSSSKTDEEQQEEKEFLIAILSLAVVICDRMVDAHDFTCAAPQDMVSLVKKLKDIIQTNNTTTVECLRTVKLTCQLVVSVVQLKPMCIKEFKEHNFKDVLSECLKILSDLDNCLMLFDVDDHHQVTKTDKPLVSLVKQVEKLFNKAQEPGNVLA